MDPHYYRVSDDLVVKVGDFGLAKDVYSSDYYRASGKDARLPVKWMAPECFNDKISSEKTDVVSVTNHNAVSYLLIISGAPHLRFLIHSFPLMWVPNIYVDNYMCVERLRVKIYTKQMHTNANALLHKIKSDQSL